MLSEEDAALVEDIKFKVSGTLIITCKDWPACKSISNIYKTQKLHEKNVFFHMFSESDTGIEAPADE